MTDLAIRDATLAAGSGVQRPMARVVPITPDLALRDIRGITRRNLLRLMRTPQLLIASIVQPTIVLLLFRYVLGGALGIRGVDYVNFMMPGIFLETVLIGGIPPRSHSPKTFKAG